MPFVLALDQGTTSSRALLFDEAGRVVATAQKEFRQIFPEPGWVEHDPTEIWATQSGVIHEALAKAGAGAHDVAAIGITNQRETTLLWERATGRPLANAIVWQDRRTAPTCAAIRAAGHEATFAAKTGLVLDAYFSGTKLKWLLDHIPGARARAARGELAFGTVDTWLAWQLTDGAVHATDPSNASRTLLYDIHAGAWDDELLAHLDVPREVPSRALVGRLRDDVLDQPPFPRDLVGDQQAALFGQSCVSQAREDTYGTGCFLLLSTRPPSPPSARRRVGLGAGPAALQRRLHRRRGVQWRDGLKIRTAPDVRRRPPRHAPTIAAFAGLGAPTTRTRATPRSTYARLLGWPPRAPVRNPSRTRAPTSSPRWRTRT